MEEIIITYGKLFVSTEFDLAGEIDIEYEDDSSKEYNSSISLTRDQTKLLIETLQKALDNGNK